MVHAHLRSSVTLERSLSIPRTKTKMIGPRGFYFTLSAAWNALPVHLHDPELSLNSFKIKLKTHFYPDIPHLGYIFMFFYAFVVRANAIIYKLASANVCIELNWRRDTSTVWRMRRRRVLEVHEGGGGGVQRRKDVVIKDNQFVLVPIWTRTLNAVDSKHFECQKYLD